MGRAPSPSQDCAHHGHNYTAVFRRKSEKPPTLLLRELRLFVWQRELSQELIWGHTHAKNPKEPPARLPAWPLASDPGRGGSHIHTHTHMCTQTHALTHSASSKSGRITRETPASPHTPRWVLFQHREPYIPEPGALGRATCAGLGIMKTESHPGSAPFQLFHTTATFSTPRVLTCKTRPPLRRAEAAA